MSESPPFSNPHDEVSKEIQRVTSTFGNIAETTLHALHGEDSETAPAELSVADIDADLIMALGEYIDQFDQLAETPGNGISEFGIINLLMSRAIDTKNDELIHKYMAIADRTAARYQAARTAFPRVRFQDALTAAMTAGSLDAELYVHSKLAEEKAAAEDTQLSTMMARALGGFSSDRRWIATCIKTLASKGLPAEEIIDRYIPKSEERVLLLASYLAQLKVGDLASKERITAAEQALARQYGGLTDEQAINLFGTAARDVADEGLRTAMLMRYWELTEGPLAEASASNTRNPRRYNEVIVSLAEVPPSARGPQEAALLQELGSIPLPAGSLADEKVIIARAIAQGMATRDVVDLIQQLSADTNVGYTEAQNDSLAIARGDDLLSMYACQYAAAGDLKGAQTFWLAISSPSAMLTAMSFCLEYATSSEQRRSFMPNELQELTHPGITNGWNMYEARAGGDKNQLAAELQNFVGKYTPAMGQMAETIGQHKSFSEAPLFDPGYGFTATAISALKHIGAEEGLPLARKLYADVRLREESQTDWNFTHLRQKLYKLLLVWGDPVTVRQRYDEAKARVSSGDRYMDSEYLELALLRNPKYARA